MRLGCRRRSCARRRPLSSSHRTARKKEGRALCPSCQISGRTGAESAGSSRSASAGAAAGAIRFGGRAIATRALGYFLRAGTGTSASPATRRLWRLAAGFATTTAKAGRGPGAETLLPEGPELAPSGPEALPDWEPERDDRRVRGFDAEVIVTSCRAILRPIILTHLQRFGSRNTKVWAQFGNYDGITGLV